MAGARLARDSAASSAGAVAAKAGNENFPVALRLLPSRRRKYLMSVYVYARTVDDIGDRAPVADRLGLLDEVEADLRRLYDGTGQPRLEAVRGLRHAVADCGMPIQPFLDLIEANRQDQKVSRYQTFAELRGYCRLSADPVGRIVLYVFGQYSPARAKLSDAICTALQLAEHWQDVAEDYRDGRVYLPADDLASYGCTEQDLAAPQAPAALAELMKFECDRAAQLLDEGAPLVGTLRGTARLAVAGYLAGGRATLAAIAAAGYDVLSATRRPGSAATAAELIKAMVRGR